MDSHSRETSRGKRMKRKGALMLVIVVATITGCFNEADEPEPLADDTFVYEDISVPKERPEFTLGLHISVWTLFEDSWSGSPEADWRTNVIQSLDWLSLTGYNTLLVDVMEAEMGTYFFKSDVLEENG